MWKRRIRTAAFVSVLLSQSHRFGQGSPTTTIFFRGYGAYPTFVRRLVLRAVMRFGDHAVSCFLESAAHRGEPHWARDHGKALLHVGPPVCEPRVNETHGAPTRRYGHGQILANEKDVNYDAEWRQSYARCTWKRWNIPTVSWVIFWMASRWWTVRSIIFTSDHGEMREHDIISITMDCMTR